MTNEFTARVRVVGTAAVIELAGELDVGTSPQLQDRIDGALAQLSGDVFVDCARLAFVDSAGLNTLVRAHQQLAAADRCLRLYEPSASLQRLLAITGLDATLRRADSLPRGSVSD